MDFFFQTPVEILWNSESEFELLLPLGRDGSSNDSMRSLIKYAILERGGNGWRMIKDSLMRRYILRIGFE
jgi:hypothetical protein